MRHQFSNTMEIFGSKSPDCGTTSTDCEWCCYFPWAFGWLKSFPGGFWMLVFSYWRVTVPPTSLLRVPVVYHTFALSKPL